MRMIRDMAEILGLLVGCLVTVFLSAGMLVILWARIIGRI